MTVQAKLDELVDKASDVFLDGLDGRSQAIARRIERMRSDVYDILQDYEKKDGRISRTRINALLRELDEIEDEIYLEFAKEMEDAITETVEDAESDMRKALLGLLGASLLLGPNGEKLNSNEIVEEAIEYVMKRKSSDGLTLPDRLHSSAGLLRDEIQKAIRYGILRNESVTKISRRVKKSFEDMSWRIERIVKTELPIAFRKIVSVLGGKLNIIKAVQIIDNRGRHRYHERHECYRLAEQDMYGWGKGLYRPEDTFIFDPHPQCSAYFRYVLDIRKLEEASDE